MVCDGDDTVATKFNGRWFNSREDERKGDNVAGTFVHVAGVSSGEEVNSKAVSRCQFD
jgi:hypothetical protein